MTAPDYVFDPDRTPGYAPTRGYRKIGTTATGEDVLAEIVTVRPDESATAGGGMLVTSIQQRLRDEFVGVALDPERWDATLGAGMALAVANNALTVTSGTTAGSVTTLLSKTVFTPACRALIGMLLSQKIANHTVEWDIVEVDQAGAVLPGPTGANGNGQPGIVGWRVSGSDSLTTTLAIAQSRPSGGVLDAVSTTVGAVTAVQVFEIEMTPDEALLHVGPMDNSGARTATQRKNNNLPDPSRRYKARLRISNGATAPASSTTTTVHFAAFVDYVESAVEVTGGRGTTAPGSAVPVLITQPTTFPIGGPASTGEQAETSTTLAANATFTSSAARDLGSDTTRRPTAIRPIVMHAAGTGPTTFGTLVFEQSTDGTTWRESARTPVPSDGLYHTFDFPLHHRYYRFRFVNGTAAQTGFYLHASRAYTEGVAQDTAKVLTFLLSGGAALAAAGASTSAAFDLGVNHQWSTVRAFAYGDQAGSFVIQHSRDGAAWRTLGAAVSNTAGGAANAEQQALMRYVRIVYTAGATALTALDLALTLVSL